MTALNDPGQPDEYNDGDDIIPHLPQGDDQSDEDWSESEDEREDGYQLLPQDPHGSMPDTQDDNFTEDYIEAPDTAATVHPGSSSLEAEAERNWRIEETRERSAIFSSESLRQATIDLNISAIQTAMAKISLPPSAVPDWADKLSEDDWKQLIEQRLGVKVKDNDEEQSKE